jgi:hypothetical protein
MRLTRHARNRLRWITRHHSGVTEAELLSRLPKSEHIGYDERGNRRVRAVVGNTTLTIVVDERGGVVITLWVE